MRPKETHEAGRARLEPALELFEGALERFVSLEEAAWSCCLSPFHFHRLFQRTIGTAPASYLRERRLTRAARELLAGERSVADLAARWGYGSPEAFSRAFRGQFHLNPGAYRRQGRPLFLRESELACPPEVAGPSGQLASTPFRAPTRRLVGLYLRGENDHPANMRRLYEFLERHPQGDDLRWTIADRYLPCEGGLRYEFFVGLDADDLSRIPQGLDVLEIPERDEVAVYFLGSVDELHGVHPADLETTLGARDLERTPSSWKLERPSGPVRWTRCGFRESVEVREN
jgi:AraC-like DNA-binding protein